MIFFVFVPRHCNIHCFVNHISLYWVMNFQRFPSHLVKMSMPYLYTFQLNHKHRFNINHKSLSLWPTSTIENFSRRFKLLHSCERRKVRITQLLRALKVFNFIFYIHWLYTMNSGVCSMEIFEVLILEGSLYPYT